MGAIEPSIAGGLLNQRVVVTGLDTRADLNGRHGFVSSWDARKSRYVVRMEGSTNEEDWNIKPANLRLWKLDAASLNFNAAQARADVARIQVPSPLPPQPVDSDIALRIALAVHEWELESPLAYHRSKDNSNKDEQSNRGPRFNGNYDESKKQKPRKFVAILSHNYTPDALKEGSHALKGRDRVLANLLDAARRVDPTHDSRLTTLAAETMMRTAGAEAMNNLDPTQYDVFLQSLHRKAKTNNTAGAGRQEDEPYTFDVFLTMLTGVDSCGSEAYEPRQGSFTTGALIPLLPGDPGVFKSLRIKARNVYPCWYPTSFQGMEERDALWCLLADGHDHHGMLKSLYAAGLVVPEDHDGFGDVEFVPGFDDPEDVRWNEWKRDNGMHPNDLCEPYARQHVKAGDLHIGWNELLLSDEECYGYQQDEALECTSLSACSCNDLVDLRAGDIVKKIEFTGNSMASYPGRWYSRAALMFWPRTHRAALLDKKAPYSFCY